MELALPAKCSRKTRPCGKKLARVKFAYGIADNVTLPASSYQTQGMLPVATGNATPKWDAENRLIEVDRADGTKVSYSYDAQSRRISKKVGSGTATRYIYDGWNIIAEYNGATLGKKYTWGMDLSGSMQGAGGVGGLLAVEEGGSVYYPTYDGNGNVSEYLDSSRAVQAHYEYDAFGNTIYSDGAKKNDFAHRFSTKPLDAETGLYYYGYRYYNPKNGRWINRDPIEERGGYNLYAMLGNDALNRLDFLGLCDFECDSDCGKVCESSSCKGEYPVVEGGCSSCQSDCRQYKRENCNGGGGEERPPVNDPPGGGSGSGSGSGSGGGCRAFFKKLFAGIVGAAKKAPKITPPSTTGTRVPRAVSGGASGVIGQVGPIALAVGEAASAGMKIVGSNQYMNDILDSAEPDYCGPTPTQSRSVGASNKRLRGN